MKLIRQFAAVLWLAVSLLAAEPPKGERVLVTAHSFHIFTAQRLAPLAKAAGIEGHELVAAQMIGGSQVIQHWKLEGERQKAKPLLTEGKVDVMTMSPHVYLPDEGINNFVELGAKQNPKMRFHVQHSWMPWDGWEGTDKITKPEDRDGRSLDIVRAANLNAPGQVVISGEPAAIDRACENAKARGAKRAIKLEVSGAFHSPLMEPAAVGLREALAGVTIRDARCPIVSNAWARPVRKADEIRQALEEQLLASVRWEESMRLLRAEGVEGFVELGTGKVLRGLLRTIDATATSWNVEDPDSLTATRSALEAAGRTA